MRKIFTFFVALLCAGTMMASEGALSGKFSVSADKQVYFSQGNLQYRASTDTWQFAANQLDTIGQANKNISDTYDGWIDLFGWGTGDNPTLASENASDYTTFVDWGTNAISNGGNEANMWRTLTAAEWEYLFRGRPQAEDLFGLGKVDGIGGCILLPDDWTPPQDVTFDFTPISKHSSWEEDSGQGYFQDESVCMQYERNTISASDWQKLEAAGAVFLNGFAGIRRGAGKAINPNQWGKYWAFPLPEETVAKCIIMQDCGFYVQIDENSFWADRYSAGAVRLVQDAPKPITEVALTISQFPKLNETRGSNSFAASVAEDADYEIKDWRFIDDADLWEGDPTDVFTPGLYAVSVCIKPKSGFVFTATDLNIADVSKITATINGETPHEVLGGWDGVPVVYIGAEFTISDPTGIDQITNDQSSIRKFTKDGQLLIIRGDKVYTVTGQEVK